MTFTTDASPTDDALQAMKKKIADQAGVNTKEVTLTVDSSSGKTKITVTVAVPSSDDVQHNMESGLGTACAASAVLNVSITKDPSIEEKDASLPVPTSSPTSAPTQAPTSTQQQQGGGEGGSGEEGSGEEGSGGGEGPSPPLPPPPVSASPSPPGSPPLLPPPAGPPPLEACAEYRVPYGAIDIDGDIDRDACKQECFGRGSTSFAYLVYKGESAASMPSCKCSDPTVKMGFIDDIYYHVYTLAGPSVRPKHYIDAGDLAADDCKARCLSKGASVWYAVRNSAFGTSVGDILSLKQSKCRCEDPSVGDQGTQLVEDPDYDTFSLAGPHPMMRPLHYVDFGDLREDECIQACSTNVTGSIWAANWNWIGDMADSENSPFTKMRKRPVSRARARGLGGISGILGYPTDGSDEGTGAGVLHDAKRCRCHDPSLEFALDPDPGFDMYSLRGEC